MAETEIPNDVEERVVALLEAKLERAFKIHGRGRFASFHEILGVIVDETQEYRTAFRYARRSTFPADLEEVRDELLDVAIVALVGAMTVECQKGALDAKD